VRKLISIGLVVALLVVSLGVMTAPLAVADVTPATVAPGPNRAGEEATYTIVFTSTEDLVEGDYIRIDFPGDTDIAAVTAVGVTVDGDSVTGIVKVDERLNIELAANLTAGPRGITIYNVINPTEAGGYTLNVSTTRERTSVESKTYTIVHAATVESIKISPEEITIAAGETQAYTAEAYDAYENLIGDVTADTIFSLNVSAGGSFGPPLSATSNVCTGKVTGTYNVTGDYSGLLDYATLTVKPGAVETLAIIQQPTDTVAGADITPAVTVNATDALGNLIPGLNITASLAVGNSGTLSGTKIQATDDDGVATFDDLWINLRGEYNLVFTANGKTDESDAFDISAGSASKLVLSPSTATVTAGTGAIKTYTANEADANGNNLGTNSTPVTFTIPVASGGVFVGDTVYNTTKAGTWTITGNESGLLGGTATLTVEPAAAVNVDILPKMTTVTSGDKQTYTAKATDAYDNIVDVTADTVFEIESGAGGVWTSNVYTSDAVGEWTVTGTYDGLEGNATLEVKQGLCFIATAAYGTADAAQINILREFRDEVMQSNSLGAELVSLYYKTSPPPAEFISQRDVLRAVVREGFVGPIVAILTWSHGLWS
jgi:hypothetical protein